MKIYHTIILSFAILLGFAASAFYIKYQPKNILHTSNGPVSLGEVYMQKVLVDAEVVNPQYGSFDVVKGASFNDKEKPFLESLSKMTFSSDLTYDKTYPKTEGLTLKIRTYIEYHSEHFKGIPFSLTVDEINYSLPRDNTIKNSAEIAIEKNYKDILPKIDHLLFLKDNNNSQNKK